MPGFETYPFRLMNSIEFKAEQDRLAENPANLTRKRDASELKRNTVQFSDDKLTVISSSLNQNKLCNANLNFSNELLIMIAIVGRKIF